MSLNKVMLIGNTGTDPEIRYMNDSQTKVARLRLATTERFTDRNGEARENTEWHTVVCWRRLADLAENYIKKGTMIYVEGRLQTRDWTDNTGAKRYSTEITADNIQLLSKRESNGNGYAQQGGSYAQSAAYGQPTGISGLPAQSNQEQASFNQGNTASTPAGPGGYQAPYQPVTPQAAANRDFNNEGDDDLPF